MASHCHYAICAYGYTILLNKSSFCHKKKKKNRTIWIFPLLLFSHVPLYRRKNSSRIFSPYGYKHTSAIREVLAISDDSSSWIAIWLHVHNLSNSSDWTSAERSPILLSTELFDKGTDLCLLAAHGHKISFISEPLKKLWSSFPFLFRFLFSFNFYFQPKGWDTK